jgi:4-hydroxythreonine-4-phosphate dehydrogenase
MPELPAPARRRPIAITLGDPCGIGPEIVLKAFAGGLPAPCVVIGDVGLLQRESERLRLGLSIRPVASPSAAFPSPAFPPGGAQSATFPPAGFAQAANPFEHFDLSVPVIATTALPAELPIGRLDARGGDAAYRYVCRAAELALRGEVRAIVTAPLAKEALHLAGHPWPGHTELLAHLAGDAKVRMMLANTELRTVLVTIHLGLRAAIDALSVPAILETLQITHQGLIRMGIESPRIAVAGLNPHAGESGLFGREEIDLIAPAIAQARAQGIDARGPFPPDTVFMQARGLETVDVVIAMYHDQGLIPVKYLGLDEGVNITIGLPFVRTSPDHGTAFDIAGKPGEQGTGLADPRSLLAAIAQAHQMSLR